MAASSDNPLATPAAPRVHEQPFGDNKLTIPTGAPDTDANHYAFLDTDKETATDHADFRQYSNAQGRWMAPDPYDGSYDIGNPQSLNRYVYAANSPLSAIDPTGEDCVYLNDEGTGVLQTIATNNPNACGGIWVPGTVQKTNVVQDTYSGNWVLEITIVPFLDPGSPWVASSGNVYNGPSQPNYANYSDTNQYMGGGVISTQGLSGGTNNLSSNGSFSEAAFIKNANTESASLDFVSATPTPPDMIADINQEIAIATQIQIQVTKSCTAAGKAIQAWEKLYPGLPMPPALTNALASCSNH